MRFSAWTWLLVAACSANGSDSSPSTGGGDDSDTPALEVVPRRIDHVVPTGTPGAPFETFVSPTVVDEVSAEVGVARPRFAAGDALIFDHLYLHQTYIRPTMTRERYALESWFFAPSVFPADQIPLVV